MSTKDYFSMYRDENDEFRRDSARTRSRQHGKRNPLAFTIILILFCVALGGAIVNSFFARSNSSAADPVTLSVESAEQTVSGETMRIGLRVKNGSRESMSSLALFVEYPEGFHFEHSNRESENAQHTYWKLDPLAASQEMVYYIDGTLEGIQGVQRAFRFRMTYALKGSRAEFVVVRDRTVTLAKSSIAIEVIGQPLIQPETDIEYTITYGDIAAFSRPSDDFEMRIRYPDTFHVTGYDPVFDRGDRWSGDLLKESLDPLKRRGQIKFMGKYASEGVGSAVVSAELGFMKDNVFIVIERGSFESILVNNDLKIETLINGSSERNPLSPDTIFDVVIRYTNTSSLPLEDVRINARIENAALDWSKLSNPSFAKYDHGTLSWSKKEAEQLSRIAPGASGELAAKVGIFGADEISRITKDGMPNEIKVTIESTVTRKNGSESMTTNQKPLVLVIPLNSDVTIKSYLKVGDMLGRAVASGVHPPQAGQASVYTVELVIENSLHELQTLSISVPLGKNSTWINESSRSAGDIAYNAKTATVLWTLNRLPLDIRSVRASFLVTLTPPVNGALDAVVQETIFDAIDKETMGKVHIVLKPLTVKNAE